MIKTKNFRFNLATFRKQFRGSSLSPGDMAGEVGNYFLAAPYAAGTLESGRQEKLVVKFTQFDCLTFVETVLALTRCVVAGKVSSAEFRRLLQLIRYRQGLINGYSSRLHYFVDWLRDNEQKKILQDVSRRMVTVRQRKKIDYMTSHRQSYRALDDENEFKKMLLVEKNISRRISRFIARDKVGQQKEKIKTGDIIAFTVNTTGLDVAHVGFALWQGKNLYFLHASSKEGAVIVSAKTLVAYLKQNRKYTGIIVARLL